MRAFILLLILVCGIQAAAQELEQLNEQRIRTNKTGMLILGGWGAANLVSGVTGLAVATDVEWRSFHGMNALWGGVNGLIAVGGYLGAVKESKKEQDLDEAYDRYRSNKKLYLINAGLDVLYIGTGAILISSSGRFNNPARWSGFGNSIVFQGIALLVFDCAMYGAHQQHNKKWVKLVSGISFTGDGVGYVYRF